MRFNLMASRTSNTAGIASREVRQMKKTLMTALLIGIGVLAIIPTIAFAKKGDLYLNKDGSCDKGDSKGRHGWCVESIAASAGSTAKGVASKGPGAPISMRIHPKPGPLVNRPPQPIP